MKPRIMAALLVSLILAAGLVGILVHRQAEVRAAVGNFGPSTQALRLDAASFRSRPVPSGIISRDQALLAAGGLRHPTDARRVRYSLVFGNFTTPYHLNPPQTVTHHPVWVFTLTGIWVEKEGHGPRAIRSAARHESDLVIDARTGHFLLSFGF